MKRLSKIYLLLFALGMVLGAQAQTNNICKESFEGWDGTDAEWLPEGWSEENTDEYIPTLSGGQFTWHVFDPKTHKSMPKATDGQYYVGIGFAQDETGDLYQDEWLLSPAYKLSEYGGTVNFDLFYSPLYLFDVSNDNLDFTNMDFVERRPSADLEMFVRPMLANGEWDQYWEFCGSLFDDWRTQYLSALLNSFASIQYHQHDTVFLTRDDFHGATVQFAFRYVGRAGYNMGMDNFRMGYAQNVTGISAAQTTAPQSATTHSYDLQGRVVRSPQGLYLKNGQKTLRR